MRPIPLGIVFATAITCASGGYAQEPPPTTGTTGTTGTTATKGTTGEEQPGVKPVPQEPSGFVAKSRAWAEKQQERLSRFTRPITDAGFSAAIGTLGQGSGLAASIGWQHDRLFGSPIDIESTAGYSYRGYELYDVRFGKLRDFKRRTTLRSADAHIATQFDAYKEREPGLGLYGNIRYRHFPNHRYWGVGPDVEKDQRTSFLLRGASYEIVSEYQRSNFFGVAARGGILDFEVGPGGDSNFPATNLVFDDTTAPGLRRQPAFAYAALATSFDTRDVASMPRKGWLVGLLASHFHALNTGPENLSFSRFAVDGRYFIPATSRSVVALRAIALHDVPDSGARVPFYMQQTLGGGDILRGFDRGRFRDATLVSLSAEYRFDVHKYVELAAFGDAGQVGRVFNSLAPGDFETSWGAGVRFKTKDTILFRTDFAVSREDRRVTFSTGPVF